MCKWMEGQYCRAIPDSLTSLQKSLDHLQVSSLSSQCQWREAVVAARVGPGSSPQQQGHQPSMAQPWGLVEGTASVAALLVHPGALQEQQLHQVRAVRTDRCREGSVCQLWTVIRALFPEELTKILRNRTCFDVKDGEKKTSRICPIIWIQKLMGSILGWDTSSIQVSGKSVQKFLCNPADKPTHRQTDTRYCMSQCNSHREHLTSSPATAALQASWQWNVGRLTYHQRRVQLLVLTVRLSSTFKEEGGVFYQTSFHRQEERSLTTRSATLQRVPTWNWNAR